MWDASTVTGFDGDHSYACSPCLTSCYVAQWWPSDFQMIFQAWFLAAVLTWVDSGS
jgi:hypothetical protein